MFDFHVIFSLSKILFCFNPCTAVHVISCKVKVNRCIRFVYSYLELIILIPTSTNNHSQKSMFLEFSAKPRLGYQFASLGLVWQKIQESLTVWHQLNWCIEKAICTFYLFRKNTTSMKSLTISSHPVDDMLTIILFLINELLRHSL